MKKWLWIPIGLMLFCIVYPGGCNLLTDAAVERDRAKLKAVLPCIRSVMKGKPATQELVSQCDGGLKLRTRGKGKDRMDWVSYRDEYQKFISVKSMSLYRDPWNEWILTESGWITF